MGNQKQPEPSKVDIETLFCLAVVRGVVERNGDTTAFFGSLLGHEHWRAKTVERGWVARSSRLVDGVELPSFTATAEGLAAHERSGVAAMLAGRCAHWDRAKLLQP